MAHYFRNDDAMMAMRGAVQAIDGFRGDAERRVKANGRVRHRDIVIDGLGQRDDVKPFLNQAQRVLVGAAAAEANERIELFLFVIANDGVGHVDHLAIHFHAVRLIATGAENGAADG